MQFSDRQLAVVARVLVESTLDHIQSAWDALTDEERDEYLIKEGSA